MPTMPRRHLPMVAPFPSTLVGLMPAEVATTSAALAEREEAHDAAVRNLNEARAVAERAPAEDHQAAKVAAAEGKKLPKEQTPAAEAKLADAERTAAAQYDPRADTGYQFLAELRTHHGEVKEALDNEIENNAAQAEDTLSHLEAVLVRARVLQGARNALGDTAGDTLAGRNASFSLRNRRPTADPLNRELRALLDQLREALA